MKRPTSADHQLVQCIPVDVAVKARGLTLANPVSDTVVSIKVTPTRKDIRTSLRTRDPQEARARQAVAVAHVEGIWAALRTGPRRLTHKETLALPSDVYRALTEALEDDPGPVERWLRAEVGNVRVEAGQYGRAALMIGADEAKRLRSVEECVGGFSSAMLARRGLVIDADSRVRLNGQVLTALRKPNLLLIKRAQGDYSPDHKAQSFPALPKAKASTGTVSLVTLFDGYAKERQLPPSTADQWRKHCETFTAFMGTDDAGKVSKADVVRWKDAFVASGNTLKTINDSKLAALRVAFTWGVNNVRIASNPATGVAVLHRKRADERMLGFRDAEAATILQAA